MHLDPRHSVRQIRRRLFLLLMQAFVAVVLLTVVLLVVLVGLFISIVSQGGTVFAPPLAAALESYYLGRGSWQGVEGVLPGASRVDPGNWERAVLLDESGRVIIDRGLAQGGSVGQVFVSHGFNIRFPLRVNGTEVGSLVYSSGMAIQLLPNLLRLAPPVAFISFFTGLLTVLIGFLLVRRMVNPLADVMAAAHAVAGGDLSARVPAEARDPDDLRALSDSFNRMAAALERSDRERRELLADVAHELRTPLTVIRGRLEGIVDGVYPADDAHVAPVLEETYLLERLVEDLRLLTLAESRQLHFDLKPVDLGEEAERTRALFEAEAAERDIVLAVRAEPGLPPVNADPQRVEQVVGNLLSNALRYVPSKGHVTIEVRRAAQGVELAVTDDGTGVPEADLPKLFDRFWRSEKSRGRAAGGAGLGLAIARQLVEAQGGTIAAVNVTGGGLRVSFVLS